jgi:voltage-gated potassium channel
MGRSSVGLQNRVYCLFYGTMPSGLTWLQKLLATLILLSVLISVLGTEETLLAIAPELFAICETAFVVIFVVEYLARLWAVGANDSYRGLMGRLRYVRTPFALIDLIAIVPFALGVFGVEVLVLRIVRLARLIVLAKLLRFSRAIRLLATVISERRFELGFTAMVGVAVVLLSATVLYAIEGTAQPEAFGSIPRAMWWAVATLTTVGYGDVYPHSVLGRLFGAITAFAGIGLFAMPTGILAAALSDALSRARQASPSTGDVAEN